MEQDKDIARGWCTTCTCRPHFHIGMGECNNCQCLSFSLDTYREALDKQNLEARTQYEETEEEFSIEETEIGVEVFLGEVSRGCSFCGAIKFYREFNNSHDPEIICNYCLYEAIEELKVDESLSEQELNALQMDFEQEIEENELAQYEAEEKQEFIDEFFRGLDE